MKLSELKKGDIITHYCSGKLVTGTIIETGKHIISEHEPVRWGNDTYTRTGISESTPLHQKWGGTDKNGNLCPGAKVTPAAFYNNEPIII